MYCSLTRPPQFRHSGIFDRLSTNVTVIRCESNESVSVYIRFHCGTVRSIVTPRGSSRRHRSSRGVGAAGIVPTSLWVAYCGFGAETAVLWKGGNSGGQSGLDRVTQRSARLMRSRRHQPPHGTICVRSKYPYRKGCRERPADHVLVFLLGECCWTAWSPEAMDCEALQRTDGCDREIPRMQA